MAEVAAAHTARQESLDVRDDTVARGSKVDFYFPPGPVEGGKRNRLRPIEGEGCKHGWAGVLAGLGRKTGREGMGWIQPKTRKRILIDFLI